MPGAPMEKISRATVETREPKFSIMCVYGGYGLMFPGKIFDKDPKVEQFSPDELKEMGGVKETREIQFATKDQAEHYLEILAKINNNQQNLIDLELDNAHYTEDQIEFTETQEKINKLVLERNKLRQELNEIPIFTKSASGFGFSVN